MKLAARSQRCSPRPGSRSRQSARSVRRSGESPRLRPASPPQWRNRALRPRKCRATCRRRLRERWALPRISRRSAAARPRPVRHPRKSCRPRNPSPPRAAVSSRKWSASSQPCVPPDRRARGRDSSVWRDLAPNRFPLRRIALRLPKRAGFSSNRHPAFALCLSMISSENRFSRPCPIIAASR